jgi:hypothetical protein
MKDILKSFLKNMAHPVAVLPPLNINLSSLFGPFGVYGYHYAQWKIDPCFKTKTFWPIHKCSLPVCPEVKGCW